MTEIAFGIDLAGYSTAKTGLAKAKRDSSGSVTVDVFREHPFAYSIKGFSLIGDAVGNDVKVLTECLSQGKVLIDMPLDLQLLGDFGRAKLVWQLTKRPVDYVFGALPPLADKIGSPVARAQALLSKLKEKHPKLACFGENIFETYPAGSLEQIELPRKGYKGQSTAFVEGKWRGEALATIANGLGLKSDGDVSLNDDDIDAVICAITGVVDAEDVLEGTELTSTINERLRQSLPPSVPKIDPTAPNGYRLLKGKDSITEIIVAERHWEEA